MEAGVEVRPLDLAALYGPRGERALTATVDEWCPTIVGISVFTEMALSAYRLAEELKSRDDVILVAGGPHATAIPQESLSRGFDVVVRREGELPLVELCRALAAGGDLTKVRGLTFFNDDGELINTPDPPSIDLDRLSPPTDALELFPRDWYLKPNGSGSFAPQILTSRGCPGRCTFCSDLVSGKKYRFHSPARIVDEMSVWYEREGSPVFAFCDTAFSVHRKRLFELCKTLKSLPFRPQWWCEARADQLDGARLAAMADAGCFSVVIGIESGDPGVISRVRKGIELDAIEATLQAANEVGIRCQLNFMLGFPGETADELDNTLRFMERISPQVDMFNPLGIVVPYPGTPIYEEHHAEQGFTSWWLDKRRVDLVNAKPADLPEECTVDDILAANAGREQSLLDARLIPYDRAVLTAIQRCLDFRKAHNRKRMTGV